MHRLVSVAIVVVVTACGGGSGGDDCSPCHCGLVCLVDAGPDAREPCDPLAQTGCAAGEKCTWIVDALLPLYVGHVGCAPVGITDAGEACLYGAPGPTGYDNCKAGLVCGNDRGDLDVCKQICDQQGGMPACDALHVCVTDKHLFDTGAMTPPLAGVCDLSCDPIADNDFDGSGALTRSGTTCGSSAGVGCFGSPSFGTPPATAWSCRQDVHAGFGPPMVGLRHRVQCTVANGCADPGPTFDVNSCNQGYVPLLIESSLVSTTICVALCVPKNCYAGNCGTNNADHLGVAPDRCSATDRVGTFDTSAGGESCRFLWSFEIDDQNNFLRSPTSDTVGFCFDHGKYLYDSNGDNMVDTPLPACAALPDGFGSGSAFGAADFGCVDTAHAMLPLQGKVPARHVFDALRPLFRRELR